MLRGWSATRRRILERDHGTCVRCGYLATQVDHIVRGGGDHDDNLQSLCAVCHRDKTQVEAVQARRAMTA